MNREAILDEIIRLTSPTDRATLPQPNITSREYALREGISAGSAYRRLSRAVEMGLLASALVTEDGIKQRVFWLPDEAVSPLDR